VGSSAGRQPFAAARGPEGAGASPSEDIPGGSASSAPPAAGAIAEKGAKARAFADVPKSPAVWIATAGGVGFGPWAPGTWGAAVTAIGFGLYLSGIGWLAYAAVIAAVTALGVWASTAAERDFARHDDGRIVIDEVAGQLVTLWPLVPLHDLALGHFDLSFGLSPETTFLQVPVFGLLVVTGFVAFRWFDIRKPGRVRWAERRFEAGAGVMADDVVAGVYGAVALIVPAYLVVITRGLGGGA
jgi:phosphatidylglycerophosphatase A